MPAKLVVLVAAGVGAVVSAAWALGPAELGRDSTTSDNYKVVQHDPSWLQYLPSESSAADIEVGSLTKETIDGDTTRRVDLLEKGHRDSVSLCFASSEANVQAACPGARVLGKTNRQVDEPWVGQLGDSDVDFLALLDGPAPTLAEADSIKS